MQWRKRGKRRLRWWQRNKPSARGLAREVSGALPETSFINHHGATTMNLIISEFQVIKLKEHTIVISEKGVTTIKSRPLIKALHKLSTLTSTQQTKKHILHTLEEFNLAPDEAFSFLEQAIHIKAVTEKHFKKIIIAHEWGCELDNILNSEFKEAFFALPINTHLTKQTQLSESLVIIMPTKYDHHKIKHIYFEIAKKHPACCLCVALRTGDSFYISQPYLSEIGGPCHFCNFDNIARTERVRPTFNNWSSLFNFCTDSHIALPEQPMTKLQFALMAGLLVERIKLWTCPGSGHRTQDRIMLSSHINLFNGQITEEHVTHWQMCDCLRPIK
ncbi:McbB family protein [Pseudomonas sp. TMW22080]|uniref:McbB family protein n=1 Tax=Pseudomonas sp. TMW22080 TaxID=2506432 RepID=UPI001F0D3B2A|nr:McbB family protein [Pseudomonas sp. TMW22080]